MTEYTLDGLLVSPIDRCTFACDHCAFESGPEKEGEIPVRQLKDYIDQMPEMKAKVFTLTGGGEPFLYNDLDETVHHANEVKQRAGYPEKIIISTNGYWITDKEETVNRLEKLKDCGLDMLAISDTVFHKEFNNSEKIKLVKSLNGDERLPEIIFYDNEKDLDYAPIGRARGNPKIKQYNYDASPFCNIDYMGIHEMGAIDSHLNVFPDGIYACCFKMYKIGELGERLSVVLNRGLKDPVIKLFGNFGVRQSLEYMVNDGMEMNLDLDLSDCSLCEDVLNSRAEMLRKWAPSALEYFIDKEIGNLNPKDVDGNEAVIGFWRDFSEKLNLNVDFY